VPALFPSACARREHVVYAPDEHVSPTPIPLLTRPRLAGHKILSCSSLDEVRTASHANTSVRQGDCRVLTTSHRSIFLCWFHRSQRYDYVQSHLSFATGNYFVFLTTTPFEVFFIIRRLRQMETTVRSGGHHTIHHGSFLFRRLGGMISCVVWS
jgi:hypothetical protein